MHNKLTIRCYAAITNQTQVRWLLSPNQIPLFYSISLTCWFSIHCAKQKITATTTTISLLHKKKFIYFWAYNLQCVIFDIVNALKMKSTTLLVYLFKVYTLSLHVFVISFISFVCLWTAFFSRSNFFLFSLGI